MNQLGFPILSLLIFLPLAGAIVALLIGRSRHAALRWWGLAVTLIDLILSIVMLASYRTGEGGMQLADTFAWIPSLGIRYHVAVDGISLYLVPLTALLFVLAVVLSWRPVGSTPEAQGDVRGYFFWLLMLEAGVLGVFLALDMVLFFVFWEAMLVPAYFLIGRWGGSRRAYATTKFIIYTMAGSAVLLVGILAFGFFSYFANGTLTFDWADLRGLALPWPAPLWLFLMFALAFAVKVPIFPFHTWQPDAYAESPTPVTILLAGLLSKMGVYGFLRFCLPFFPGVLKDATPWIGALAVAGIIYCSLAALGQRDLKRIIAYSSLAHLSLVVLGVFVMNEQSLAGAVIQMASHGIYVAALFIVVGVLEERRGSRMVPDFGGVWKPAPVLGVCFLIATFGAIGLPGLNGFVGEFSILVGVFQSSPWLAGLSALTMVLGAWYMLWTFQRVMQGKTTDARNEAILDVRGRELVALVPLLLLIFLIGILPNLVLTPALSTVAGLAARAPSIWVPLVP